MEKLDGYIIIYSLAFFYGARVFFLTPYVLFGILSFVISLVSKNVKKLQTKKNFILVLILLSGMFGIISLILEYTHLEVITHTHYQSWGAAFAQPDILFMQSLGLGFAVWFFSIICGLLGQRVSRAVKAK